MTDEELEKTIQEVSESLDNLPEPDEHTPRHRREMLLLKKKTLFKIKEAKKKGNSSQELRNSVYYSLLTSWGEKHPFLLSLVMSQLRWSRF